MITDNFNNTNNYFDGNEDYNEIYGMEKNSFKKKKYKKQKLR
jgi:hypothetical protein